MREVTICGTVAALCSELDAKNLLFHLFKMARIVSVRNEGGKDVVELVRDVSIRFCEL